MTDELKKAIESAKTDEEKKAVAEKFRDEIKQLSDEELEGIAGGVVLFIARKCKEDPSIIAKGIYKKGGAL